MTDDAPDDVARVIAAARSIGLVLSPDGAAPIAASIERTTLQFDEALDHITAILRDEDGARLAAANLVRFASEEPPRDR